MDAHSKVDCGNLGNIVVFLNGKFSLEKRIQFSKNIFFSSSNVPPQHKEEVVVIWLIDILSTNKVLTLSSEEVKLVWKTLRELLSSRRLKALCTQHWVCPLTAPFIQTLITAACGSDDGTSRDVQEEALLICHTLIQVPSLSPQVALLTKQTLKIFTSLLSLTCEGYRPPSLVSQLSLLLQKSSFILKYEFKKHNSLCVIYEKLSLPLLEVLFVFKDEREDEAATKLVSAIETFLFSTILSKEEGHLYLSILDFPLQRESVESLSTFGESVFAFLRSLINKEDKCKASYFLREFCGCFFKVFRTVDVVPYQFIVIVMNLLGVSLEEGPRVQKNNLSSRSLLPIQLLSRLDRDRFIAAVLESLLSNNIELSLTVSDVTLKTWLENLGEHLVTKRDVNVNTLSCLKIIICADPLSRSKSRFLPHLLVVDRTNTNITELLDEILCEILNIHVKLRTVDLFYTDLCETLLTMSTKSTSISLLTKQHDLTYYQDSQFLLPHNFFAKFLLSIKEMGSQMWMKTWHSIHKVISESCLESLKNESSSSESVSRIAYTVWLSSCCLGASSVTKTAALSGLPSKVARLMNSLAHEGIIPLVNEMMQLTTEASSSSMLCCSLLRVILVWGELHSTLMSISSEYRNHTDFPFELSNDCTVPKNLSLVIPFIEPSSWKKIFSLLNDREDCERALIIQVMIQKLSVLKIQRSEIQILKNDSIDSSIMNILNYVLEIKDPSIYPITTDIIAMHLPSFLPHMKKFHFDVVSRCLVFGISERRESWIQFVSSSFFKGSELLQSRCFNLICEKLLAILSAGRKRKLDDDEEAAAAQPHPLSQKLLSSLLTLQQEGSKSLVELEKDMTSLLVSVETLLMARNETCKFLTTREEGHVTTMLQIVDSFPISFLRPKLLLSVLAFTIIITVEEGGFMGRKAITVLLLRILNKVFVASNSHSIFKLSKRKPYSTLLWLERECQVVLKAVSVEECHLRVITTQRDKRVSDDDTLQALLVAMSRFTNSFVIWDKNGDKIKNYLDEIVNIVSLEESKDAGYLTAAILVHTLRENLPSCLSPDLTKGLEAFSSWCWKIVEEMDLSKITKVPIAWALITFSFLLQANLWLNKNRHTSDIDSSNAQSKIKQRVEANFIEWKILGKNGLQLAEIAAETEDASLRTLALEFYINVLASTKLIKNNEWGMSERIWSLMFLLDDSSTYMKDFVSALSPTQFKTVKKVLLEETQFGKMESPRFLKWLSVFSSSSCNTSQTLQTFFEQLTGILCIRFGSPNTTAAQASCYHSLYLLFISILQSEKNSLSHHHRSLILGMISQCSFTHLPYDDYFKTFQTATKLLNILLSSDHPFLPNRPSSFLSAIMALIAYLLDKTDLDDKEAVLLLEPQLREVEKCCAQIEMIVKNLKSNDRSFFKISSFTLASVLEKMHRTKMLPSVKMSMERIVFSLLDLSDPYSLRHLLVTLPPSVTTVLKHYHSTFNATFKFDPRIS